MVTWGGVDWGVEGVTCVVKEVVALAGTKSGEDWDKEKGAVSVEGAGVVALAEAESWEDQEREKGAVSVDGVVALAESES